MTVQPTRDQLRALADAATPGPCEVHGSLIGIGRAKPDFGQTWGLHWRQDIEFICAARTAVPQLLDQLDAAEQRIRDLTQEARDERAACLDQMEQVRIRDARIKAVEDVLDAAEDGQSTDPVTRTMYPRMINTAETRHALGTVTTPRT